MSKVEALVPGPTDWSSRCVAPCFRGRIVGAALALTWVIGTMMPTSAVALTLDFEDLHAGHILGPTSLTPEVVITVRDNAPNGPNAGVVFDSSCPGGCSGGDDDLQTPGTGAGNETAQGNVLVISDNIVDNNGDGFVDGPGDENDGGVIELLLRTPHKLVSLKVLDIEPSETPSGVELDLVGGSTASFAFATPGNNSVQTATVGVAEPATAIRVILDGSGAIDDIELVRACGDGLVDTGEVCDPPDGQTCGHDCLPLSSCMSEQAAPINDGASCTDRDDLCTVEDICADGVCVGTPVCTPGCQRCDGGECSSLCGNPFRQENDAVTISDALYNLRAGVELEECALCICDVTHDNQITAADTLVILRFLVLLPAVFDCPDYPELPLETTTAAR